MIEISNFDHIGIRISDREKTVAFYELLGFELIADGGFDQGHPLVMLHPSGININLLGPATAKPGENILMDEEPKYPGITHLAVKVKDAEATEDFVTANGIAITGVASFAAPRPYLSAIPIETFWNLSGLVLLSRR